MEEDSIRLPAHLREYCARGGDRQRDSRPEGHGVRMMDRVELRGPGLQAGEGQAESDFTPSPEWL